MPTFKHLLAIQHIPYNEQMNVRNKKSPKFPINEKNRSLDLSNIEDA